MKKILLFGFTLILAINTFAQTDDGDGSVEDSSIPDSEAKEEDTREQQVLDHNSKLKINSFSVGPRFAMPLTTLDSLYKNGYGAAASFDLGISDHIAFTGNIGYTRHAFIPSLGLSFASTTLTSIQAGIKYYSGKNQDGFYGELVLGILKSRYVVNDVLIGKVNNFSVTPALGFKYHGANLRVAYEYVPTKANEYSILSVSLLLDLVKTKKDGSSIPEETH